MTLRVESAQESSSGNKSINEDSMGLLVPEDQRLLTHKGAALAIADGVSSAEAGREAAETCVTSFLSDYYSTPETWTVETSARKVLGALNSWLFRRGSRFIDAHRGLVSTLSILIVKSRTAYLFHVGDTRIYLLRQGSLKQLTHDHTTRISAEQTYLARAMGLDSKVEVDFSQLQVDPGDVFLLTTDGIHNHLDEQAIASTVESENDLSAACHSLIDQALARGSEDNLTCQILRIVELTEPCADEYLNRLTALPFPPELNPSMVLDGFKVERVLHMSRRSQLFVVQDASGKRLVMKTPSVNFEDDAPYIERFILEHWVGTRAQSRHLVRSVDPPENRSCLYHLMEYVEGKTLSQWMKERHRPEERVESAVKWVVQISRGLLALHRNQILHQDIKPDNIIINVEGDAVIVDYGSCFVAGIEELPTPIERERALGTIDYAAPEYTLGIRARPNSDLYSLGCLAYELMTLKHPYGQAVAAARSRHDFERLKYEPAYRHNPHVPVWMDGALRKALAIDPDERYQELSELTYDLEHPNEEYLATVMNKAQRDPADHWRKIALALMITQLLTILYIATR